MKGQRLTGLGFFIQFMEREGKMPKASDFQNFGFHRSTYYKVRDRYYDYIKARAEELREGGSPLATFEDDIAEGFIGGESNE